MGRDSATMSYLSTLDEQQRELERRFPGWQVWYVPHIDRTITWCARPQPLLNEDSPEALTQAITQVEASRAGRQ
jgi:hypothetical protein